MDIEACPIPEGAFLRSDVPADAYADCYTTVIVRPVTFAQYVEAFYSTALFGVERRVLQWFVAKPSTAADIHELAEGGRDAFAAWKVERRSADQLLLGDFTGRTKSWLMIRPDGESTTHLYFGSAVLPVTNRKTGAKSLGVGFQSLLGFHKLYSRSLLSAAKARLEKANAH